jgi:hypothetical protein
MITTDNLPVGYTPYETITVCSNKITGGGNLVTMGNVIPLLIGKGAKPVIWLQAVSNPTTKQFLTVVDASIARHPAIRVSEENGKIIVTAAGKVVIAVKAISDGIAEVLELDLRPLGLNLYGDKTKLVAGGTHLSRSTFSGVGTVISFSG